MTTDEIFSGQLFAILAMFLNIDYLAFLKGSQRRIYYFIISEQGDEGNIIPKVGITYFSLFVLIFVIYSLYNLWQLENILVYMENLGVSSSINSSKQLVTLFIFTCLVFFSFFSFCFLFLLQSMEI